MGTVKIETDIDVQQVVNATGLSELVACVVASHGPADLAHELCDDRDFVNNLVSELTPEQLVRAIMHGASATSLTEHYWLARVQLLLNRECDELAGKEAKIDDGPPMVGAMGEVVVGGLRWRFLGDHARDTVFDVLKGWRVPTIADFTTASETLDGAIPDGDPATISLAWVGGMEVSAGNTILWHIGTGRPVIGSARDTAALFAVKKVEP